MGRRCIIALRVNYTFFDYFMQKFLDQTEIELKLRNYSHRTIDAYIGCLADYFNFLNADPTQPDIAKIKEFLLGK